ncbi:hypothetical protein GC194_13545 [bacterium]|nr:hypothetical protein [bacterium]
MRILKTIWAAWGVLVFIILMFPALPFYIVAIALWGSKAIQKVHFISRLWARGIFILCGIFPKNMGSYKLRKKQAYVLISNHLSALDIPLCAIVTANPFRFLSKAELGKIPVLGWIIRNIYLTVDRGNAVARQKSMERMKDALYEGSSLFIYPEGTRNRGKELTTKFFDGAFRLAIESGQPLGILVIDNGKELCPPYGFYLRPGRLKYMWAGEIDASKYNLTEVDDLKNEAKNIIENSLKKMRNE